MSPLNPYESEKFLGEYLLFHYGSANELMPWSSDLQQAANFPIRTVNELIDLTTLARNATALDLGCGVGRSSFELRRYCASVRAFDYSRSFIAAAEKILSGNDLHYDVQEEAHMHKSFIARRPEAIDACGISFEWGDAQNLPDNIGQFDIVHAANLLCRLNAPETLLQRLPKLVAAGGQLILTTPCTWLEQYTPPDR